MPWTNEHLQWLQDTGETITTSCGKTVPIYEFRYDMADEAIMSNWARHFRNHYCLDCDLPILKPEGMSSSEYLLTIKFPNRSNPGPSIRAGDFSEILVADYLQFLRDYYVPRTRYDRKIIGNESSKGSDVMGFKQIDHEPNNNDELVIYEVKAKLSENSITNVLQTAINDSSKDETRLAESLNGIKQRLYDRHDLDGVSVISRFQRNIDAPYKTIYGAAAVLTETSCRLDTLAESNSANHVAATNLEMLVIRGQHLMTLVHELFDRAANEA
ncbi:virulence associated protein [uncultured Desulfosarcina sp.]|uniref:virulence associated protein n=1 Tax=uncultured Desulfosarcina sp. TaxID=218289 RepID=UPI0029C92CD2|nr:virulence associated protein [uncultured Desulfosarcina sp.]